MEIEWCFLSIQNAILSYAPPHPNVAVCCVCVRACVCVFCPRRIWKFEWCFLSIGNDAQIRNVEWCFLSIRVGYGIFEWGFLSIGYGNGILNNAWRLITAPPTLQSCFLSLSYGILSYAFWALPMEFWVIWVMLSKHRILMVCEHWVWISEK